LSVLIVIAVAMATNRIVTPARCDLRWLCARDLTLTQVREKKSTTSSSSSSSSSSSNAPLPPGWSEHTTATGRAYWFNAASGKSQWTRPGAKTTDDVEKRCVIVSISCGVCMISLSSPQQQDVALAAVEESRQEVDGPLALGYGVRCR
jgi:hypothetical protein